MQPAALNARHRPLAQRELEVPVTTYEAPEGLKHADITSIYIRAAKGGKFYVGVQFTEQKADKLQARLKKHHINTGDNVKSSLQYDTKKAERQRELVKIAKHDRVISQEQADALLALINSRA